MEIIDFVDDVHVRTAGERGLRIAWTADTHSHADYVSGGPELAARGARFVAPRAGHLETPHAPIDPGTEIELAPGRVLRAIATPGHTPEHLAYAKNEDAEVSLFLLGDSASAAKSGQQTPNGYYNVERMLTSAMRKGATVRVCGTCMDARGLTDTELVEGAAHSSMDELSEMTVNADKVLVF